MISLICMVLCFSNDIYLQPYDAIEVKIWRQDELSNWYLVDDDTTATIPLFGRFSVVDMSVDSLYGFLLDGFQKYYSDVPIDINFFYRVDIFGEVKVPGNYYVRSEDNLTNLLSQAGGPTSAGSLNGIRILNEGVERRINYRDVLKSGEDLEKLALHPGDVVIVPRRFMAEFQEWSVILTLGTLILQIYIAANQ